MTETTTERDYGPLRTYEITWRNRPPEMVQGHQVLFDSQSLGYALPGWSPPPASLEPKFRIHGEFPGRRWRLVICAPEADMVSIRDVTEQVAALEAMAGSEADQ